MARSWETIVDQATILVCPFVELANGRQAEMREVVAEFFQVLFAQHFPVPLIRAPSHAGEFHMFRVLFAMGKLESRAIRLGRALVLVRLLVDCGLSRLLSSFHPHRAVCAAAIFLRAAAESVRLPRIGTTLADSRTFAQRFLWPAAIRARADADSFRVPVSLSICITKGGKRGTNSAKFLGQAISFLL